jgi:hypothetical protein
MCLFTPSVTVCDVVCVRLMTCVTYAVNSVDLWRFDTRTRGWESVVTNGDVPRGRYSHVMTSVTTSVGVDLWMHGGMTISPAIELGDLWRFDTSTRGWFLVHDTPIVLSPRDAPRPVPNSRTISGRPVPAPRYRHAMTSVGQDLWLYGGEEFWMSGEGDSCSSSPVLLLLLR